jgi:predicted RecB family nuclease
VRKTHDKLRVSASDLSNFLACRHLTRLDAARANGLIQGPGRRDVGLDALIARGEQHEQVIRERFLSRGWTMESIPIDFEHPEVSATATLDAMERGVDVVDQAVFLVDDRFGRMDFLIRASLLRGDGDGYEVVDAKLARSAKAQAVLQVAFYSRLLGSVQNRPPRYMHLALGGADDLLSFEVASFGAYERQVDRMLTEFLDASEGEIPPSDTYPDPNEHCVICRWNAHCIKRRREDDDISFVAGISSRQRVALKADGIATLESFAALEQLPDLSLVGAKALARSHAQAKLQAEGRRLGRPIWELVSLDRDEDGTFVPNRGLLALPEPAEGDLFFDIEGARYYSEDAKEFGLQYLFGIVDSADIDENRQPRYHSFWAFDRAGEKHAFEQLVDFIAMRRLRHPGLHVYHYNHYEPTSVTHLADLHETREEIVGRLMGRFATHEDEVDDFFRQSVFVDLFRVVRQGVRASVESYSIKSLEPLCGYKRRVALADVNERMVIFESALEDGSAEGDGETRAIISGYNEDDCRATLALRDWLEERRIDLAAQVADSVPRPTPPEEPEDHTDPGVRALRQDLVARLPVDEASRNAQESARALAASLLEWHRREDRPKWWRWFHQLGLDDEELIGERDALSGLEFVGVIGTVGRSELVRFTFPPQEHPFSTGDDALDRSGRGWPIEQLNEAGGYVDLRRGPNRAGETPTCLFQRTIVQTPEQRERLKQLAERIRDLGDSDWPADAALDLLLGRTPNVGSDGELRSLDEEASVAGARLASVLDRSYLPIQGPPGTGKTYTGAMQILALAESRKRLGVTATSHAVISNLLDEASRQAESKGFPLRVGQKGASDGSHMSVAAQTQGHVFKSNDAALKALRGEVDVLGGTSWLWAREEFANSVDVLIVDEASQMSLANTLAIAHAATNLILLGDPQQLGQPSQAAHPPGADASALSHILQDEPTMPPQRGLFIERTRRMHPDVCRFTSEVFYQDRLKPIDGLELQTVLGQGEFAGTGLRFVPVQHEGNANASPEEAEVVAELVEELQNKAWRNSEGRELAIKDADLLVITPFNAQIREIERALARKGFDSVRVGTVDKFQGQQAVVAIYSMAASSADDAPRGAEFLFDLHRLNVATSRARCEAIVVASPQLTRVMCRTPRQMQLVNALCRFGELTRRPA